MESGDEHDSEENGMNKFSPTQPAHCQRFLALEKPTKAANQKRQECQFRKSGQKSETPGQQEGRCQQHLSCQEAASTNELFATNR